MLVVVFLLIIAVLIIWMLVLMRYNEANLIREGVAQFTKCLIVCIVVFFLISGLIVFDKNKGSYRDFNIFFLRLSAIAIDLLILSIWGIISYQNAGKLIPSNNTTIDVLDNDLTNQ